MSVLLLYGRNNPHTFMDGLESSFWVLLWTALMMLGCSLSLDARFSLVNHVLNAVAEEGAGRQKKFPLCMQEGFRMQEPPFPRHPALCKLLSKQADVFKPLYAKPPTREAEPIEHLRGIPDGNKSITFAETHRLSEAQRAFQNHSTLIEGTVVARGRCRLGWCLRHPQRAPSLSLPPRHRSAPARSVPDSLARARVNSGAHVGEPWVVRIRIYQGAIGAIVRATSARDDGIEQRLVFLLR